MRQKSKIAVVVPCYNEAEGLEYFHKETRKVCNKLSKQASFDIIFVNDGSADNTQDVIESIEKHDTHVRHIAFAANFGHQSALRAGLTFATPLYDAIIMLDADLQHPPKYFKDMLDLWEQGNLIVQMVRNDKANKPSLFKYATSKTYYKVINGMANLELEEGASDFRLIDQTVARTIADSPEQNIFLRGYFAWLPVKRVSLSYVPQDRKFGKTKYSLKKMLTLGYQGVLQFSEKPLIFTMSVGIFTAFAAILYGLVLVIQKLNGDPAVSGWTSMMAVMLFCFGLNFIFLGVIGMYLAHNMKITKSRPEYIIRDQNVSGSTN